jgi:hypothetical protein
MGIPSFSFGTTDTTRSVGTVGTWHSIDSNVLNRAHPSMNSGRAEI